MKILKIENNDKETLDIVRKFRSEFYDLATAIMDIEKFVTNPEKYEGDMNALQAVFNSIQCVGSTIQYTASQKAIMNTISNKVSDMSGNSL